MRIKIILLVGLLFMASCVSYKNSSLKKNEKLSLNVNEDPEVLSFMNMETQSDPLYASRGILAGQAFSMATQGIKYLIDLDRKKYTANYAVSFEDLYFYSHFSTLGPFDPSGIQFNKIEILRMVTNDEGKEDTALYIRFAMDLENPYEIINNSTFRLIMEEFKMKYCKAKLPQAKWYLPWTVFVKSRKNINLDIQLSILASWTNDKMEVHRDEQIGQFSLNLREVPLDPKAPGYAEYFKSLKGKKLDGYSFLVPRSYGHFYTPQHNYETCYGQGLYKVNASLTESGHEQYVAKIVSDNTDKILNNMEKVKGKIRR